MSSPLPERSQHDAALDGQRAREVDENARRLMAAVQDAMKTSHRDDSPVPTIGPTPPVPQPGRPAMSSKATDDSVRMLSFGAMSLLTGGGAAVVMVASGAANPAVIGMICAAPIAFAVPILALSRLARRSGEAAPQENHQHVHGDVYQDQRTVHTSTRGVWAKTNNKEK